MVKNLLWKYHFPFNETKILCSFLCPYSFIEKRDMLKHELF